MVVAGGFWAGAWEVTGPVVRALPAMAALALVPGLVLLAARRHRAILSRLPDRGRRALVVLVLAAAIAVGYLIVWDRLALFDDAFISFRYARHFAEGHGLVWNPGERVEGYTNFLWTLMIGLLVRGTPWEAPEIGLWLSLACFAPAVLTVALLGRRLAGARWLPLAAPLYALHTVATAYGSTGMETGFCALLVTLGALALVRAEGFAGHALAGLALIAATLTRPDHAVFYAVGSAVVAGEQIHALRSARRAGEAPPWRGSLLRVAGYAAPFALYLAYLAWKVPYYGHLMPNTWLAKGAGEPWYSQGFIYLALFWIGTNAWIPALMTVIGASWRGDRAQLRFGAFAVGSLVLFDLYVARVGGDYMHGRFLLSLLPLALVGGELLVHRLAARGRWTATAVAAGLLLASGWTPQLFDGRERHWHVVDENVIYPVRRVWPEVEVRQDHWRLGRFLRDEVRGRGLEPVIATGSIGMVGYYSDLTLVDCLGLTDATVARRPVGSRNKPGHEKTAPTWYLKQRGVQLVRGKSGQRDFHPKRFRSLAALSFEEAGIKDRWQVARYDRELMEGLARVPGVEFEDFDAWLDDYVASLPLRSREQVADDLAWFRAYWFDHNHDPERLTLVERRAGALLAWAPDSREFALVSVGELLSPQAAPVPAELLRGDLLVGSLSRPVAPPKTALTGGALRRGALARLPAQGVDLVSLAAEPLMDGGITGLEETIAGLEQRGVATVGAGIKRRDASRARIVAGGGARIAVIGLALPSSEEARQERFTRRQQGGVWSARSVIVADTVAGLKERRQVDVIVARVDWGGAERQERERVARELFALGVDVIDGQGADDRGAIERTGGEVVVGSKGALGHPGATAVRYVFADGDLDRIEVVELAD